jgi:transposase, IS30 family
MARYTHLSPDERYTIQAEHKRKTPLREIARCLGRHPSSISRELQRNTGQRGYRPRQAQIKANERRHLHPSQITAFAFAFIEYLLQQKWSPEQISGALRANGWIGVPCHEWIYQHIYADKAQGGTLHTHLRSQKTYRKRGFAANDRRGVLKDRVSIHARPEHINRRERLGDFEGDTIIGAGHKGAVLTLVDRKSLYTLMTALPNKQAQLTMDACVSWAKQVSISSITFDNGKEFSAHVRLKAMGVDAYFADPYRSNQRARNENTNGLIRQYLPKGIALDKLLDADIELIQRALNHRPRKSLNWLTPAQVFAGTHGVALRT